MKKPVSIRIVLASLFLGICTFALTTVLCQCAYASVILCDCCMGASPNCGICGVMDGGTNCIPSTLQTPYNRYNPGPTPGGGYCNDPNGCCIGIIKAH